MASGNPSNYTERMDEEAAAWLARMNSDQVTEADRFAFRKWLRRSPQHQKAYEQMKALWSDMGNIPDPRPRHQPASVNQTQNSRPSKKQAASPDVRRGVRRGALAACLLFAMFATFWGRSTVLWVQADYRTATGQNRVVELPDGSQAHLNTSTALGLEFDDRVRRVRLYDGEAFFDVVPDAARPFEVAAGDGITRVTGTRFNVRQEQGGVTVTVVSGSVEVLKSEGRETPPASVNLHPGQAAHYSGGQPAVETREVNETEAISWREGKLVFTDRPLREVAEELERYRRGSIVLMDDAFAEARFTGVIHLSNIDPALDAIAESLSANAIHLSDYLVLIFPKS